MRYIILMLFSCHLWAAVSFDYAKEIYRRIVTANNINYAPQIYYSDSSEVNAYYDGRGVTLNDGILKFSQNDAEIALVIGHELAHYTLGHVMSTPSNEYAADARGAMYMSRLGYSVCKGALLIKRFHSPDTKTHPNSDSRYYKICNK